MVQRPLRPLQLPNARAMKRAWRMVSLRTMTRAHRAGWNWKEDPRRPGRHYLESPRGTLFEFRSRPLSLRYLMVKEFWQT
jgi:hypothetical protein